MEFLALEIERQQTLLELKHDIFSTTGDAVDTWRLDLVILRNRNQAADQTCVYICMKKTGKDFIMLWSESCRGIALSRFSHIISNEITTK